jgi:aspartate kinase
MAGCSQFHKTDANYRAEVDWELTQKNISKKRKAKILNITQGFRF